MACDKSSKYKKANFNLNNTIYIILIASDLKREHRINYNSFNYTLDI